MFNGKEETDREWRQRRNIDLKRNYEFANQGKPLDIPLITIMQIRKYMALIRKYNTEGKEHGRRT